MEQYYFAAVKAVFFLTVVLGFYFWQRHDLKKAEEAARRKDAEAHDAGNQAQNTNH